MVRGTGHDGAITVADVERTAGGHPPPKADNESDARPHGGAQLTQLPQKARAKQAAMRAAIGELDGA